MKNVLVIGSYNVGLTVVGPRIPRPGETIMGTHFDMGPGGKGSNQAITIARLGGNVSFLAKIGGDIFGKDAIALFEKECIDTGYVTVDQTTHTGAGIIFVDENGQNAIGVAPGANYRLSADDLKRHSSLFEQCDILLIQLEIPLATVYEAIRMGSRTGMTIILNPAPAQKIEHRFLSMIDILTPNETEAETLTDIAVSDRKGAVKAGKFLVSQGVESVIVTLGNDGAVLVSDGEEGHFPSYAVDAVDTTGAGDAFNGGLAYGLATGKLLESSIDFASKVAALSVTKVGVIPGLPRMQDIEKHFGKAW
jgi:ribokinase